MNRPALLALALGALTACDVESETPPWRIAAPRFLAIAADPPVATLEDEVALRALVVGADGLQAAAAIEWRVCSPWRPVIDPASDCPPEAALVLPHQDGGARLSIAAAAARFVDRPFELPPPDDICDFTPPVQLTLVATTTVDGLELTATKDLGVATERRRLPEISNVTVGGVTMPTRFWPGDEMSVFGHPNRLSLDSRCANEPPHEPILERVRFNYYVTAGELSAADADTRYPLGVEEAESVTLTIPPGIPSVVFWAVAVDRDGGVAWLSHHLEPYDTP